MDARRFSTSLRNLPLLNVCAIVEKHSKTKASKLEKGYKFFYEKYIFNYEGKFNVNSITTKIASLAS